MIQPLSSGAAAQDLAGSVAALSDLLQSSTETSLALAQKLLRVSAAGALEGLQGPSPRLPGRHGRLRPAALIRAGEVKLRAVGLWAGLRAQAGALSALPYRSVLILSGGEGGRGTLVAATDLHLDHLTFSFGSPDFAAFAEHR